MTTSKVKSKPIWRRKRSWFLLLLIAVYGLLLSNRGTRILMQTAANHPKSQAATPVLSPTDLSDWENIQTKKLKELFQTHIYGDFPLEMTLRAEEMSRLPGTYFDNSATVDIANLTLINTENEKTRSFGLVIIRPIESEARIPIIVSQNFCPNHNVVPINGVPKPQNITFDCSGDGMMSNVFLYFFGRHITTPPIKDIMQRGYAFAAVYPTEFVPDSAQAGQLILNDYFDNFEVSERPGALMAWAAQFSLLSDYLETKLGFSKSIVYGHSRFGKTALIAAAFNPEIDGVIAHQSGTGGASLSRDKPGETVSDITNGYPHWFGNRYQNYALSQKELPVDQHQLLALIAPRPILLGNARRDVWSDPNGGFRAAQGVNPVYQLYGNSGLTAKKLSDFNPEDKISFWIRPGTHGVVKEDWPAFLDFLDAQLK